MGLLLFLLFRGNHEFFFFLRRKKKEVFLILNAFCGKKYGCTKREYTDVDGLINPREDQLVRYVLLLGDLAKYYFNG